MGPAECLQRVVIASLVYAVIGGSCSAVMAQNDLRLLRIPDPLSGENLPLRLLPQEVPLPGVPAVDCRFGTRLTRVTRQPGIRHEYARFDPFNKDQSLTLLLVRLDARHPEAFYLAKLHNTTGTYWEETHATISNDGARVVWADNWGQSVGQEKCFLMQLDRPPADR